MTTERATVVVHFQGDWRDGLGTTVVEVSGQPEESFQEAWLAAANLFGIELIDSCGILSLRDEDRPIGICAIDSRTTLAQVAALQDGCPLDIRPGGVGGSWFPYLWEIVSTGLTLAGLAAAFEKGIKHFEQVVNRPKHEGARRWMADGCPTPPELSFLQMVLAQPTYTTDSVCGTFGISESTAFTLMRAVGYVFAPSLAKGGGGVWHDPQHRPDGRPIHS